MAHVPSITHSPGNRKRCPEPQPSARQAIENEVPLRFLAKLPCNTKAEVELVEFEHEV
jgi:hypothetical protein